MSASDRHGGHTYNVPEVGSHLVTAIGYLRVLLGGALGNLELVGVVDAVGAVSTATDLAAVSAVAQNLSFHQQHDSSYKYLTYARC